MSINTYKRIEARKHKRGSNLTNEHDIKNSVKRSIIATSSFALRWTYYIIIVFRNILIFIYPFLLAVFIISFLILMSAAPSILIIFSATK